MSAAQHFLDQVQSLARIEALEGAPGAYAELLEGELGELETLEGLEGRDAQLGHGLGQVDAMIERVMRLRLEHALAADGSIAAPTRKVFASTVVGYAGRLALLEARAREVAARGGAAEPAEVAEAVCEAARAALALRAEVRGGVLAMIRRRAAAALPEAERAARDRRLDDGTRRRWSAMRRELEAVSSEPERVAAGPLAARLAAWPEQLDEPEVEREPTFADMLELD